MIEVGRFQVSAWFAFVLAPSFIFGKHIPSFAGPYRLIIRRTTNITDEVSSTGDIWFGLKASTPKPGQPQYLWGVSYNKFDINDDMKVEIRLASFSNNQWKKNAFVLKFNHACSDLVNHVQSVGLMLFGKDGSRCPIKAGLRQIKNRTYDLEVPHIPIFPYGRWFGNARLFRNGDIVGLMDLYLDTVPRV